MRQLSQLSHEPEAGVLDSRWHVRENVDVLGEL